MRILIFCFSTLFNHLFDNNDSTKKLGAHDLIYTEFREEFAGVILFIIRASGEKLHPSEHMPNKAFLPGI